MIFLDEKTRLENIQSCLERGFPDMQGQAPHWGRWNICGGGPSLRKEYSKLKKGVIVSVNGSHDYLLSKKVKPDVFVMVDPREHNERFVRRPQRGIKYLIAAHCDPEVFDRLEGYDVEIWYPIEYGLPLPSIGGGSTVGMRAISIGYILGFRNIHLYGFDGCMKESHHAYPQKENDDEPVKKITYQGKDFYMTEWQCAQAHNFEEMVKHLDFNLTVHSSGVIKHIRNYYAS